MGVEALTDCLEILGCNLSFKAKQFGAASMPPALDGPILVVVVTLSQMALLVTVAAGHRSNRQHGPTLALFEIQDQARREVPKRINDEGGPSSLKQSGSHRAETPLGIFGIQS